MNSLHVRPALPRWFCGSAFCAFLVCADIVSTYGQDRPTGGIIGSATDSGARITPEAAEHPGAHRYRFALGDQDNPRRGFTERLFDLRPAIEENEADFTLVLTGNTQVLAEASPGGLAALSWGFALMDNDDIAELVRSPQLLVNGRALAPKQAGGGRLTFDYPTDVIFELAELHLQATIAFFDARLPVVLPLSATRAPRLDLQNLTVRGLFLDCPAASAPPFVPCSRIDASGHFSFYAPKEWFKEVPIGSVILYKSVDGAWERQSRQSVEVDLESDHPWVRIPLDAQVADFWQLPDGLYRFGVDFAEIGQRTPPFDQSHLIGALRQRLDALADDLTGLDYETWSAAYQSDDNEAARHLWKTVYHRAGGFTVSVDATNATERESNLSVEVEVRGLFAGTPPISYGTWGVRLGQGEPDANEILIPSGGTRTLTFSPFPLAEDSAAHRALLSELLGFEVRVRPHLPGPEGHDTQYAQVVGPSGESEEEALADHRRLLGLAMRVQKPRLARVGTALETYEEALALVMNDPNAGPAAKASYQDGKARVESDYEQLKSLHQILTDHLESYGKTGLGLLDVLMSKYYSQGKRLHFGSGYSRGPSFTAPGASTRLDEVNRFTLVNSPWRTRWAATGAFIKPDLSFALDPAWVTTPGSDGGGANPVAQPGVILPGIDRWVWERESRFALTDFHYDPALRAAFDELVRQRGVISEELLRRIRNADFEQALGRIHEEVAFRNVLEPEVERLRQQMPQFRGRIVALAGDQVRSRGQELTDGVIIGVAADGSVHLLRILEAKGGQSSANGLGEQFAKDIVRFKASGADISLTPEQRETLGLRSGDLRLGPGQLRADFTNPGLFRPAVPRGVSAANSRIAAPADADPALLSEAEQAAVRRALADANQADYNATRLVSLTELMFQRERVVAHPWDARELTFDEFAQLSRRHQPAATDADLEARYQAGERYDPETGQWRRVFAPWEAPFVSPAESLRLWEQHTAGRRRMPRTRAENMANAGYRFDPTANNGQGSWIDPFNVNERAFIVDLRDPTMPEADFLRFWRRTKPANNTMTEAEVLAARRAGRVYDPVSGNFRDPTPRERTFTTAYRRATATINPRDLRHTPNAEANEAVLNAWAEGVERMSAAMTELNRVGEEQLLVQVEQKGADVWITVSLQIGRQNFPLPPDRQKGLLQRWFQHANHFWTTGELPAWLR
jgi:hypothetical protein